MDIKFKANGSDIVVVYCDVLDAQGNVVTFTGDNHPIKFSIEGDATIVGDNSIGANPICAEAGIASILVRAGRVAGKITIKAELLWEQRSCVRIEDSTLEIKSV